MTISMEELNPFIETVELNGKVFETTAFNLRMETWAAKYFDSLEKFIEKIRKGEPTAVLGCFHTMTKNKKHTFKDFVNQFHSKENGQKIADHVSNLIMDAQPRVINPKRAQEIKEALGKTEDQEDEDFSISFDKIARRYGYTIEQFYSLTSRQIHAMFKALDIEDYKTLEVKAALHGKKLKDRIKYMDVTPEEEKEHLEAAEGAMERLRKRAAEKNK